MNATKKRYVHLMLYFSPTQQKKETKFCERSSSKSIHSDGMGLYIYINKKLSNRNIKTKKKREKWV